MFLCLTPLCCVASFSSTVVPIPINKEVDASPACSAAAAAAASMLFISLRGVQPGFFLFFMSSFSERNVTCWRRFKSQKHQPGTLCATWQIHHVISFAYRPRPRPCPWAETSSPTSSCPCPCPCPCRCRCRCRCRCCLIVDVDVGGQQASQWGLLSLFSYLSLLRFYRARGQGRFGF